MILSDELTLNHCNGIHLRKIFAKSRIRIYSGSIGDIKDSALLAESSIRNTDVVQNNDGFRLKNCLLMPVLSTGIAGWFRVDDFRTNWIDGTAGYSGCDIILSNTHLTTGSTLSIDFFSIGFSTEEEQIKESWFFNLFSNLRNFIKPRAK